MHDFGLPHDEVVARGGYGRRGDIHAELRLAAIPAGIVGQIGGCHEGHGPGVLARGCDHHDLAERLFAFYQRL